MILVLGTPRSGTSCVAGVLHHLGVPMGEDIMPPDDWNPKGYFQDKAFEMALAEGIGVFTFPASIDRSAHEQTAEKLRALIASREGLWGVKSNRLAYFMDVVPSDAKIIRTRRPEADSIASWTERARGQDGTSNIRNMNRVVTKALKDRPHLEVEYNKLLANPALWVSRIAEFIGVPVTQTAVDFVEPELRRFNG